MFNLIRCGATWFVAAFAVVAAVVWSSGSAAAYPPAGTDQYDSAAKVTINLGGAITETATGPTQIRRGSPYNPGDGRMRIDTEIVSMELHWRSSLGSIIITENPTRQSSGYVRQKTAGVDFPAESVFDLYVLIDSPLGRLHNNDPITMSTDINAIPPLQATYKTPVVIDVPLFNESGVQVGTITHAEQFVSEKPSFSVAPGGPSGLSSADIFDVPTVARIPAANLGLVANDDLDGLSYGLDPTDGYVGFSVAPGASGKAGSAVATEAAKVPSEAHGDEFVVYSPLLSATNVQVLDENGSTAPAFPLLVSDDVDALTEQPASFVDTDGNTVPDSGKPVYFSLAPGSPTLGTIGATPADILVNVVPPALPVVFISRAALGLAVGDDLEDFCLDDATQTVIFSLAPGSPTLTALGASPSDLFFVRAPTASPPAVFASAGSLGLLTTDNLNALKCMWMFHPVGGIIGPTDLASSPLETTEPGRNYTPYVAGAAAAGGLLVVLTFVAARHARRRWLN